MTDTPKIGPCCGCIYHDEYDGGAACAAGECLLLDEIEAIEAEDAALQGGDRGHNSQEVTHG